MSDWDGLERELDAWGATGRTATMWWRDDDAAAPTAELEQLFALHAACGVPLALAVIPGRMAGGLAARLAAQRDAGYDLAVLQHGYRHVNFAGDGEKKCELGDHRPAPVVLGELAAGWQALDALPGRLAVLVPPWNRISPRLVPMLSELGYSGLSTFDARARLHPAPGLIQINTHIDPIDWKCRRQTYSAAAISAQAVRHLCARRMGQVDSGEPTGLLTHHLAFDEAAWDACRALFDHSAPHAAVRWLRVQDMFE